MKTILRLVKYTAISIYALCGIMLIVFLVPKTGWKALSVATGSMTPAIPRGSLVIIHHVNPHVLRVGDVVTYINPNNTKETITHRIVGVSTINSNIPGFITKGDANTISDKQILGGNVVGRVVWHAPVLGRVLSWAKRPVGLIVLVLIPGLLIIIDEIRRMVKALSQTEPATKPVPKPALEPAPVVTKPRPKQVSTRKRPRMDGIIKSLALIAMVVSVAAGVTRASLTSSAALTGNTIATAPSGPNHILIERVFIGGNGQGGTVCPTLNSNASIIDSSGTNVIIISNSCHVISSSTTSVTVDSANDQTSTTGLASNSDNTSGGSATSGDAGNSNSTSTTVHVGAGGNGQQWVELYNPTASSISLAGWTLQDDSGQVEHLPTRQLRSNHAIFVRASFFGASIGDGLSGAGDRVIIRNRFGALVDALSWGSDTSILNPSVAAIPAGGSAKRINALVDTDTAADWQILAP